MDPAVIPVERLHDGYVPADTEGGTMRRALVAIFGGLLTAACLGSPATAAPPVAAQSPPTPVPKPPTAELVSSTGRVTARLGSYCWQASGAGLCVDTAFIDPADALAVRPGETLTLRFVTDDAPTAVSGRRYPLPDAAASSTAFPVAAANPTQVRAGLPPGTSWLTFATRWARGDAIYFFKVQVPPRAQPATAGPATAVRRQPRFTG